MSNTVAGRKAHATQTSAEIQDPLNDCPKCGATMEKIKKKLYGKEEDKRPSREDVIRRMKEAGFGTTTSKKHKKDGYNS